VRWGLPPIPSSRRECPTCLMGDTTIQKFPGRIVRVFTCYSTFILSLDPTFSLSYVVLCSARFVLSALFHPPVEPLDFLPTPAQRPNLGGDPRLPDPPPQHNLQESLPSLPCGRCPCERSRTKPLRPIMSRHYALSLFLFHVDLVVGARGYGFPRANTSHI